MDEEKDLLERGYAKCSIPPSYKYQCCSGFYQKRFDDDVGKKYFIDAIQYEPFRHPHTGELCGGGFEYSTQLHQKRTHLPINLEFFAGWSVDDVEEHLERLFASGDYDYYEWWDGSRSANADCPNMV